MQICLSVLAGVCFCHSWQKHTAAHRVKQGADHSSGFSLLSFVLLIYSPLSDEERVLHLLWASHGSGALFSDSRASPANCLRRFRNGLRVCGCHHLPPRAHNGLQGQTRRESTLVIPFCPIGSSLSTASQILIRGFVISHASFPCQQIRPGQAPAGWLPQKQLLASELS